MVGDTKKMKLLRQTIRRLIIEAINYPEEYTEEDKKFIERELPIRIQEETEKMENILIDSIKKGWRLPQRVWYMFDGKNLLKNLYWALNRDRTQRKGSILKFKLASMRDASPFIQLMESSPEIIEFSQQAQAYIEFTDKLITMVESGDEDWLSMKDIAQSSPEGFKQAFELGEYL